MNYGYKNRSRWILSGLPSPLRKVGNKKCLRTASKHFPVHCVMIPFHIQLYCHQPTTSSAFLVRGGNTLPRHDKMFLSRRKATYSLKTIEDMTLNCHLVWHKLVPLPSERNLWRWACDVLKNMEESYLAPEICQKPWITRRTQSQHQQPQHKKSTWWTGGRLEDCDTSTYSL